MGNHGLKAVPSRANFLLVLFEGKLTAESAYKGLMEAGYATRWLPGQGLPNALRITIGTEAQTRDVARLLREMAEAGRLCCLFPASRSLVWVLSAPHWRARSKRRCRSEKHPSELQSLMRLSYAVL